MDEKSALAQQISAIDFAIWELHIFLDTHPLNREALQRYEALRNERAGLAEEYEERFGALERPLPSGQCWQWTKSPWPWEAQAEGADA